MDDAIVAVAEAIGTRVRTARTARGWTLDRLAETAGVSRRALVNVEQGTANPSVGTLLRISDALGVGLPALVEAPEPQDVIVTRAGEGAVLWSGPSGGRGLLVAGTRPPDVLELWDWTLAAGEEHSSEAHARGTRELLQVQEGRIAVHVGDRTVALAAGDAVGFAGDVEHGYAHVEGAPARFTLAVLEPGHLERLGPDARIARRTIAGARSAVPPPSPPAEGA
jgi:transcriptional regulator with XRE-family HTH domain